MKMLDKYDFKGGDIISSLKWNGDKREHYGNSTDDIPSGLAEGDKAYFYDEEKRKIYNGSTFEDYIESTKLINSNGNEVFSPQYPGAVYINDGANCDAFMRFRVSNPVGIFDSQMQYNDQPLFWQTSTTGGGTSTHLPNESSIALQVGTNSGDKVIRQTKQYFRYQAGKSQCIFISNVMGEAKTNVRKRIGYFDADNGLFFEQDGTGLKVVRRTKTSGTAVDNPVAQANWNLDKFDGSGASGVTIDMSKSQIFIIDFEWLGVGRVRFGFVHDGRIIYCHEFLNNNSLDTVYMTTGNLPVRYEIENTGASTSSTTMKQICCSVMSEGGIEIEKGITHSASNGASAISVITRRPILSIRPKTTFNSITNRGFIIPILLDLFATDNSYFYEIVLNGSLTGDSWSSVGDNSLIERDVSATAISNGEILQSGFAAASNVNRNSIHSEINLKLALANNIAGDSTDILTVVATSMNGTADCSAAITVKELY